MATRNQSSTLLTTIYKSREILLELLNSQMYNISEYAGFSVHEINAMFASNQLDMLVEKPTRINKKLAKEFISNTPTTTKMYIHYQLLKGLSEPIIKEWVSRLFEVEQTLTHNDILLFVIKEEKINDNLGNYIKRLWEEGIYIIVYPIQRLQFNLTKHQKVPPHTILPEVTNAKIGGDGESVLSAENLRKRYNIDDDNVLPKISRTDPAAMAIFMRPGEICEIKRPTKTAINTYFYRICT